jgi:hypothetical protein
MTDRFTEANAELTERNPYIYSSSMATYGHQTIGRIDEKPGHGDDLNTRSADCIHDCDPMPFGD